MNIKNHGVAIGNLTEAPRVFENKDGSKKVRLTVGVKDNFQTGTERGTQFIQLEAFIKAGAAGIGPYAYMFKGSHVGFGYRVQSNNYTNAAGEAVYSQVLQITDVDLMDTKDRAEALRARAEGAKVEVAAVEADEEQAFVE